MPNSQEYKCPKCFLWDFGFPITNGRMECNGCGYIGNLKEFEAKRYHCYAQITVAVIAFNEEDAKKEFDILRKDDFDSYFDKLIKIIEAK